MKASELDCKSIIRNAPIGWTHYEIKTSKNWVPNYYNDTEKDAKIWDWTEGRWSYIPSIPENGSIIGMKQIENLFTREEIEEQAYPDYVKTYLKRGGINNDKLLLVDDRGAVIGRQIENVLNFDLENQSATVTIVFDGFYEDLK